MKKLVLASGAGGLWICVVAVGIAGASSAAQAPLGVVQASLRQDGQELVWRVKLDHRFAPAALTKGGRELCLLIERPADGGVSGAACVKPSKDGRTPQLGYQRVSGARWGPGKAIRATISRRGGLDLTARFAPGRIGNSFKSIRWQVLSTLSAPACSPPTPNPLGCTTVFPAKPSLAKLHTPKVVGCVPNGPPYVTNGSRGRHVVALTFDDGPWPDTPQFLDVLEKNHIHATFFQIGQQVGTYGRTVDNRMLADGDMIGDHTWDHAGVAGGGPFAAGEISRTAAAIRRLTGFTPCLFRAPGGAVSGALISQARSMGFTTIEWDVDPRDWSRPGTGAIYSSVVGNVRNGSFILQHDGGGDRSETLAALPQEISTLRSRGYRFVTVTELLGLRLIYK